MNRIIRHSLLVMSMTLGGQGVMVSAIANPALEAVLVAPSSGKRYAPTETLRIDLPEETDLSILMGLTVELNGIDITKVLKLDGADFLYRPAQPLEEGLHTLRLVSNGIQEIESWSIAVQTDADPAAEQQIGTLDDQADAASSTQQNEAEEWLNATTIQGSNMLEASYRFFESGSGQHPGRTQVSGGGSYAGQTSGEDWQASFRANYLIETQEDISATGEAIDLGEYELNYQQDLGAANLSATLGHHDVMQPIGGDSLLLTAEQRRGASVHTALEDQRLAGTVFAMRPDAVIGADHATGLFDDQNRIDGAIVTARPFSDHDLRLTGIYYTGEGRTSTGVGVTEADTTFAQAQGEGWALKADSYLWENRLYAMGEFAHADYDADGAQNASDDKDRMAYRFLFEATPFDDLRWDDQLVQLTFGFEREHVDTFYGSLANPYIASDRLADKVYANMNVGSWQHNLTIAEESNNTEELVNLPTDRLRYVQLDSAYYFQTQEALWSWLGTPYLRGMATLSEVDRKKTPIGYAGPGTDLDTQNWRVEFGSQYEKLHWSLAHTVALYDDYINTTADSRNHITDIMAYYTPNDRLALNIGAQIGRYRDLDLMQNQHNSNINVGAFAVLVPEKLTFNMQYNVNFIDDATDSQDNHNLFSEMEWTVIPAMTNRPGVSLALSSLWEDGNGSINQQLGNNFNANQNDLRLFTTLRIAAPVSWYH